MVNPVLINNLPLFTDFRGSIFVIEKLNLFDIKRMFYIVGKLGFERGGHAHRKTKMLLFCTYGQVEVKVHYNNIITSYLLEPLGSVLFLEPYHWHTMNFNIDNSVLFVAASEEYDENDYLYNKDA